MDKLDLVELVYQTVHVYTGLYICPEEEYDEATELFTQNAFDVIQYQCDASLTKHDGYHKLILTRISDMDDQLFATFQGINYVFVSGNESFKLFMETYHETLEANNKIHVIKV